MRGVLKAGLVLAAVVVGPMAMLSAEEPEAKPAPKATAPAAEQPAKPAAEEPKKTEEAGRPAAAAEFPKAVKKKMYAGKDVRGQKAPELKVEKWLTAEPKMEGKVVLVDFWATWCPPCRALIPELNEWQKEFKDDLVVIGISDEPEAKVKPFMGKTKVEYSMAVDTRTEQVKKTLGVQGIPHVLVIDSKGVVRWQGFPQSEEDRLTTEVLRTIIAADQAQRGGEKPKKAEPGPTDQKK